MAKMLMLAKPISRVDMLFSMDDPDHWLTVRRGIFTLDEFKDRVNATGAPFYSTVKTQGIALSREFPLKEVVDFVKVPYFSNTICYMLAYAMFQKVDSVDLYGIAQMGAHEYVQEKAGVEFWIGMLLGHGIQVNIKTTSALLQNSSSYPYGYVKTLKELKEDGKL